MKKIAGMIKISKTSNRAILRTMGKVIKCIKNLLRSLKSFVVRKIIRKQFNDDFISSDFGFNRGTPVDRFYIGKFFSKHRKFVSGECLEFGDTSYTDRYGVNVSKKATFNYSDNNSISDEHLFGDISKIETLPSNVFDCILCVNVLNFIYDTPAALLGLRKLLRPNGHVMLTVAGPLAHISQYDMDRWGDYWRLTDKVVTTLADDAGFDVLELETFGNPYSCSAQLNGFCVEELIEEKVGPTNSNYQLVVACLLSKRKNF